MVTASPRLRRNPRWQPRLARALGALLAFGLLAGCATYRPPETPYRDFLERIEWQEKGDLRVGAVVLSSKESRAAFNTKLAKSLVQLIWIEIENDTDEEQIVMLLSIDPNYYSPSEAAWTTRSLGERRGSEKMAYFASQHLPVSIPPHSRENGFVYTNYDPAVKQFVVKLIGETETHTFDFLQALKGYQIDFAQVDFENLYPAEEARDLDLNGLRSYLESLPCCVLGGDEKTPGDPLNLVIVGPGMGIVGTFVRNGWDLTETVRFGTAWKTTMSSMFGRYYRTSPVSPLFLFGRGQDMAFQRARKTVDERNHLRLWLAPVTFQGQDVWIGQISRDIGVKLSSRTFVTHRIDPVIDEARLYVLFNLASSGYLDQFGFVKGVGPSLRADPRINYTKDPYYTDGFRVVLFLNSEFHEYLDINVVPWEEPAALIGHDLHDLPKD